MKEKFNMSQTKVTGVPQARVEIVKRAFMRAGAISVVAVSEDGGTFTVVATFADEATHDDMRTQVKESLQAGT